jgi:hypothetical protein
LQTRPSGAEQTGRLFRLTSSVERLLSASARPYNNDHQTPLIDRDRSYLASPSLTQCLSEVGAFGARMLQTLKELSLSFSEG